jgi:hypothetical protein
LESEPRSQPRKSRSSAISLGYPSLMGDHEATNESHQPCDNQNLPFVLDGRVGALERPVTFGILFKTNGNYLTLFARKLRV